MKVRRVRPKLLDRVALSVAWKRNTRVVEYELFGQIPVNALDERWVDRHDSDVGIVESDNHEQRAAQKKCHRSDEQ